MIAPLAAADPSVGSDAFYSSANKPLAGASRLAIGRLMLASDEGARIGLARGFQTVSLAGLLAEARPGAASDKAPAEPITASPSSGDSGADASEAGSAKKASEQDAVDARPSNAGHSADPPAGQDPAPETSKDNAAEGWSKPGGSSSGSEETGTEAGSETDGAAEDHRMPLPYSVITERAAKQKADEEQAISDSRKGGFIELTFGPGGTAKVIPPPAAVGPDIAPNLFIDSNGRYILNNPEAFSLGLFGGYMFNDDIGVRGGFRSFSGEFTTIDAGLGMYYGGDNRFILKTGLSFFSTGEAGFHVELGYAYLWPAGFSLGFTYGLAQDFGNERAGAQLSFHLGRRFF